VRIAYFDCFSGISGDMTLGALVDAGVDREIFLDIVRRLSLGAELTFESVKRGSFRATYARVIAPHEHAHRHLHHVEAIIDKAGLDARDAELARRIFLKLAEAESKAHGSDIKKVHFHEVGAVDSIVDIVCAAVGLNRLKVDRFECSPLPPGRGSVRAAHGRMPLPAPGTAELLKGVPIAESTADFEQTTPTGAAIAVTVCERFGPLPAMTIEAIGHGAGTADPPDLANLLRLFVGRVDATTQSDQVWVIETNLDDESGEIIGHTTGKLLAAGALDVFLTPVVMKKGRPGTVITVLCDSQLVAPLESILLNETSTLGVRRYAVQRHTLGRKRVDVDTPLGTIRGKVAFTAGAENAPRFTPEYDDCARIANERSMPLREVYEAARAAFASMRS
jgi:uncharacterized protein (TIGR00299 family) protein